MKTNTETTYAALRAGTTTTSIRNIITLAVIASAGVVNAQTSITPASISTSITGSGGRPASQMIDGDATKFNGFTATGGELGSFDLTFAGAYDIISFELWNDYGTELGHGIRDFSVEFFNGSNSLGSYLATASAGNSGNTIPQSFDLGAGYNHVTKATLNVTSAYTNIQVRELAFTGTQVPEPSSAILLITASLGIAARRKR